MQIKLAKVLEIPRLLCVSFLRIILAKGIELFSRIQLNKKLSIRRIGTWETGFLTNLVLTELRSFLPSLLKF